MERITEYIKPGEGVTVVGQKTKTTGAFVGLGINERDEAIVSVQPKDSPLPFAYTLNEVKGLHRSDFATEKGDTP